jgi:hypothetical protein
MARQQTQAPRTMTLAASLDNRNSAFNKSLMKECSFLNGNYIPALTAYEYRGYLISAWARPEFKNGSTSVGIIYKRGRLGSITQVQRIEGELFETKEQAEQHGVELCKEWIDKQKPETVVLAERTRPTSEPQARGTLSEEEKRGKRLDCLSHT